MNKTAAIYAIVVSVFFSIESFSQNHFTFVSNTGNNMTVLVQSVINPSANGRPLSFGDEIGVFTPDGLCIGGIVWNNKNAAISVWGENEQTPVADGAKNGDILQFRIWDAEGNAEYSAVVDFASGSRSYSADGIAIVSRIAAEVKNSTGKSKCIVDRSASEVASRSLKADSSATLHSEPNGSYSDKKSKSRAADGAEVPNKKSTGKGSVANVQNVIELLSPADSALLSNDSTILSWHCRENKLKGYHVEISKDSSMEKPVFDSALYATDTFMVVRSLSNGAYWWRVRQDDGSVVYGKSNKRRFVISHPYLKSNPFSFVWQPGDTAGNRCSILFVIPEMSLVKFQIVNSFEKKIRQVHENMAAGKNLITVSTDKLEKGKYTYILETDFFTIQSKFFVE